MQYRTPAQASPKTVATEGHKEWDGETSRAYKSFLSPLHVGGEEGARLGGKVRLFSTVLAAACTTLLLGATTLAAPPAEARAISHRLDIPAQDLASALQALGAAANEQVLFSDDVVAGLHSPQLKGEYSTDEAVTLLLQGSGLKADRTPSGVLLIRSPHSSPQQQGTSSSLLPLREGSLRLSQWDSPQTPGTPDPGTAEKPNQKGFWSRFRLAQADTASQSEEENKNPSSRDNEKKVIELEEIVVTGTHIRGAAPVGSPLIVIDREEIKASGHGRVQDLLEELSQNFSGSANEDGSLDRGANNLTRGAAIDLRGLGASSTLVLIDGRRQPGGGVEGSFVDISSIATSAVERIEVLTDGASALYGADAIGGVVNFILRKDYEGLETNARLATTDGHSEELQTSVLGGKNWERGNILVGYQYSHRDVLHAADTPYSSLNKDFSSKGGDDFRTPGGSPGTIYSLETGQPAFAIPLGQDGVNLSVNDLIPGQNYADNVTGIAVLPEQTQHSAFFTFSHDVNDRIGIFAEARYSQRRMKAPSTEPTTFFFVPPSNPFYIDPFGTGGPVVVQYSPTRELGGLVTYTSDTKTYSLAGGGVAHLAHEWELNVAASYGREENAWKILNGIDTGALLDACLDGSAGSPGSPCPGAPLNVFGDGSNSSAAAIDALRITSMQGATSITSSLSAIVDGPLVHFPGGSAKLAMGLDYRDERLQAGPRGFLVNATGVFTSSRVLLGDLDRQVSAVFGELALPLFGVENAVRGARRLDMTLAARYEDYSDFGSTVNPKIGLNFMPVTGVNLRGSWGTSFRAPRFNEISPGINPSRASGTIGVPDPLSSSPSGRSNVISLTGVVPKLQPETADIWTTGLDLTPSWLPGLSISTTYFHIDYADKILAGGFGVFGTLPAGDQWAEIITRNPSAAQVADICSGADFVGSCPPNVAAILDLRLRNLGGLKVRGADFNVAYRTTVSLGNLNFGLGGTRLLSHELTTSSTAPFFDVLDTVDHPLDLRLRGTIGWDFRQWHLNAAVNYADRYRDDLNDRPVGSWTTVNANASYRFESGGLHGLTLQLSAINLFDREPPFVNQLPVGFDSANANESGRSVSMVITKEW